MLPLWLLEKGGGLKLSRSCLQAAEKPGADAYATRTPCRQVAKKPCNGCTRVLAREPGVLSLVLIASDPSGSWQIGHTRRNAALVR